MPPKSTSKKTQKKEDVVEIVPVESDPEEPEPDPVPVKKNTKNNKKTASVVEPEQIAVPSRKEKKIDTIVHDWGAIGDDISVEEVQTNNSDDDEPEVQRNTFRSGGKNTRPQLSKQQSRFANSATNFNYQTYTDLDTPVNELSNKDLVKILITRSYGENQHDFCKTMKTVLRAMNLECPMPGTRPIIEGQPSSTYGQPRQPSRNTQQSSGKPYQTQSQSMFGQRVQKRTSDPHDF